jgi:hypothetical protein
MIAVADRTVDVIPASGATPWRKINIANSRKAAALAKERPRIFHGRLPWTRKCPRIPQANEPKAAAAAVTVMVVHIEASVFLLAMLIVSG